MNFIFPAPANAPRGQRIQSRLLMFAAMFLFLFALILTLSPAVRMRSWETTYRWEHWLGFAVWLVGSAIIHRALVRALPDRDPYLFPIAALLSGWGLLTIWRLDTGFGLRQTIWLAVCLAVVFAGLRIAQPLALLRRYKYVWLTGGLLLTALTFVLGTYPGGDGPRLWLGCCGIYFHPSEPLKLLLIVYLAAYLADSVLSSFSLIQLLTPTLLLLGVSLGVLVAQRDLGTAILFLLIYFLIIFMASGQRRILLIAAVTIVAAALLGYQLFGVIQVRVNAWLDPWADAGGQSYQIVQSIIAVASGGLSGAGPGLGSPGIVPVSHSDFIFSSIAEETGLAGTLALLGLLAVLAGRGLLAALRAPNSYQRYLAAGLATYLALQSIMIIAGNIRLLPLTGVTLPFVSYGGSSLLTSFVTLLILLLISNQPEDEPAPIINATPYFLAGSAVFIALVLIALINGWWAIVRGEDLTARPDNPRWAITDRFVPRGALVDRENEVIATSVGEPGEITRQLLHPPLGPVVGYTHPLYGQSGLEASLDPYLRGVQGVPYSTIWVNQILYNQNPPGRTVRLSIDLTLQTIVDQLLEGQRGAAVLLNGLSGEVLVMASHPYFDPNLIGEQWNEWIQDDAAPLVNRVTQGQYPPGTALGPFLLAANFARGSVTDVPVEFTIDFEGQAWECAIEPASTSNWGEVIASGCPGAVASLGAVLPQVELISLYRNIGFTETPQIVLPVAAPVSLQSELADPYLTSLGQDGSLVSPLQMAIAAGTLSSGGTRPSPLLAAAVDTPMQGWVVLRNSVSSAALPPAAAQATTSALAVASSPFWQSVGVGFTPEGPVTWYLGGTRPDVWQGAPLALVLILEEDNPDLALRLGERLLRMSIQP